MAVVIADSADLAEDAASSIALDIEPLPVAMNRDCAYHTDALLYEDAESNIAAKLDAAKGDAAAAFKAHKGYVRRETFRVHRHTAVAMEGRGLLAQWDETAGHMTLYGAAKVPFTNRRILAKFLGLPESAVLRSNPLAAR